MRTLPTIANTPSLVLRGTDVHNVTTGRYVGGAVVCPACEELILVPAEPENFVGARHRSYERADGAWSHWLYKVGCTSCDWPRPLPHDIGITKPIAEYEVLDDAVEAAERHAHSEGGDLVSSPTLTHRTYVNEVATSKCVWAFGS